MLRIRNRTDWDNYLNELVPGLHPNFLWEEDEVQELHNSITKIVYSYGHNKRIAKKHRIKINDLFGQFERAVFFKKLSR